MFEAILIAGGGALIGTIAWKLSHHHRVATPFAAPWAHPVEPDLAFAAKGYVQVSVIRRYAPAFDLHKLAFGYATELSQAGCSDGQARSARWGGAFAIEDDLANFDDAIAAYKQSAVEMGFTGDRSEEEAARMYETAGLLVMATMHTSDPSEYQRFLAHINR